MLQRIYITVFFLFFFSFSPSLTGFFFFGFFLHHFECSVSIVEFLELVGAWERTHVTDDISQVFVSERHQPDDYHRHYSAKLPYIADTKISGEYVSKTHAYRVNFSKRGN